MSLAKELAKLSQSSPASINIDQDHFDSLDAKRNFGAKPLEVVAHVEEAHHEGFSKAKRGKLLRNIEVGTKYFGRVVTRSALKNLSESESGSELLKSDFESSNDVEQKISSEIEANSEEASIQNEGEEYSDSSECTFEEDDKDGVVIRKLSHIDHQKVAVHTKAQMKLWGDLVGFRIRMQPLLSKAMELPPPKHQKTLVKKHKSLKEQYTIASAEIASVLDGLLKIRDLATNSSPFFKSRKSRKRMRSSFESSDLVWRYVADDNKTAREYYNEAFDRWHLRSVHSSNLSGKKLKSLNQSISSQVEQAMSSGRDVLRKSQMSSSKIFFDIQDTQESNTQVLRYDPEVYSDSAFYQHLLKEFVSTAGFEVAKSSGELGNISKKLKKSKKDNVDVKASKGRRLRYAVHDKLVSFVTPKEINEPSINVDQLLRSLFT